MIFKQKVEQISMPKVLEKVFRELTISNKGCLVVNCKSPFTTYGITHFSCFLLSIISQNHSLFSSAFIKHSSR